MSTKKKPAPAPAKPTPAKSKKPAPATAKDKEPVSNGTNNITSGKWYGGSGITAALAPKQTSNPKRVAYPLTPEEVEVSTAPYPDPAPEPGITELGFIQDRLKKSVLDTHLLLDIYTELNARLKKSLEALEKLV